ncbi:carbohydrate ABC transporter permease [Carnobacterium inhibens]|uniref:carbohydrate ABC transporter permease n=1 Tax=Carnobacterium inhibens TaxID=147709 RepID=UPI00203D764E|nr:carbohydrate ABC transporter permease [Carnobacterium inhibens]MCM3512234.1 carbohydrate ABC transporter permease [Carnobacterium inhibens]
MLNYTEFDKRMLVVNRIIIGFLVVITLLPLIYVLVASFMDPTTLLNKGISFNPKDWTLTGYERVFADGSILRGFLNSIFYSVTFSVLTVFITMITAYPLSKANLVGKGPIMTFLIITMFFGGGLVPTYLLLKNMNMINTVWALIIPGAVNVFNIILAKTYFQGIPKELSEAAVMDGANEFHILFKIMLPIAKPIIFVLFLYAFVGQWNSYFEAMIYLQDPKLEPLQMVLRKILIQNEPSQNMIGAQTEMAAIKEIAELIKYATIVISSLPLLIMYPFFQKYFDKGTLVGSVKG